jgi:ACS family hexuronate transporter-like MFS transporter
LIVKIVAHVLQSTGNYAIPFAMAGSAYLLALAIIQILAPNLTMAQVGVRDM